MSAAVGIALTTACHRFGWPVARGGSQSIADALAADLRAHGGKIETGVRVRELPTADAVVLDMAPAGVADVAGERLPSRVARAYRAYKHGPAAFKVDFAVEGGVPWTNEACRRAGSVHLCGSFEEIAAAERDVNRGRMPERPFVLVAQQYLADPERSSGDVHPVWSYAHVPSGYTGDASEALIGQIERFAPGFRERILAKHVITAAELECYNPNYIGGDINGGIQDFWQLFTRPTIQLVPYNTPNKRIYICSSSTPPGGGVHGMCGYFAAQSALRRAL
jgi:phytoene dehydrogenase-like protein